MHDAIGPGANDEDRKPLPTVLFAASTNSDHLVHGVRARADAVADPTGQTTSCNEPASELYREPRTITCAACSRATGVRSPRDFPPEHVL